jgi:hypothetical protein
MEDEQIKALSRMIGEQNTTIGYQDAMLARLDAELALARAVCEELQQALHDERARVAARRDRAAAHAANTELIDIDDLAAALNWIGRIDNFGGGQICQIDASGKPTMILFEFGCPACSEIASKNTEEYGIALVTIVNAAHAYFAMMKATQP